LGKERGEEEEGEGEEDNTIRLREGEEGMKQQPKGKLLLRERPIELQIFLRRMGWHAKAR
jgi:hypothetical protein